MVKWSLILLTKSLFHHVCYRSAPAKAVSSELEPVPEHCAVAARCSLIVHLGQERIIKNNLLNENYFLQSHSSHILCSFAHLLTLTVSYSKPKPSPMCVMKARHLRVSRGPACVWTQLTHHRNIRCTQTATQWPGQHSCQRQSILYMLSTWLDLVGSLYDEALISLMERKRNLPHVTAQPG